jgi:hypothetical protein
MGRCVTLLNLKSGDRARFAGSAPHAPRVLPIIKVADTGLALDRNAKRSLLPGPVSRVPDHNPRRW